MTILLRAQIHPADNTAPLPVQIPIARDIRYYIRKLTQVWFSLQLSHHGGEYSIERLIALDEYTQRTSLFRVLVVCLGTPLPIIFITIIQEMIPLQDPSEGWRYNYGFWIRYALLGAFLTHAMGVHAIYMIGEVTLSGAQLILCGVSVGVCLVPVSMIISEFWTFPIPFVQITLDMLFVSIVIASYRGMIGSTAFNRLLSRRVPLLRYLSFIIFQVVMTIVYPSYQVLFDLAADSQYELIVFLLLPVIKTVMKKILSLAVSHMEDLIPETVIFTVDFFNALYLATCMQRATSVVTVAVIMIFDFSQTAFALFRLHRCTQRIMTQLQQANHSDNLLEAIRSLCFNHRRQKGQGRRGIRVYSCMPHQLTVSGTILLSSLNDPMHSTEDLQSFLQLCKVKALAPKSPLSQSKANVRTGMVVNLTKNSILNTRRIIPESAAGRSSESQHVLHDTLEVLFTSECLLLAEYLEAVIPLLYGNYMMMMVHLPNAKYHTELEGITKDNVYSTVQTVFVYAILEFSSFAALIMLLQRNCGMRGLHQLAFVLETHMPLVQTKMFTWVLVTLSYRVLHFGVDFKFQFAWMKNDDA